jgi:hypothetical protein
MYKVKFFSDYTDSKNLLYNFLTKYEILDDTLSYTTGEDYQYAVVFNRTEDRVLETAKTITVIQEPSWHEVHRDTTYLECSDYLIINDPALFESTHKIILGGQVIESPSYLFYYDHVPLSFFRKIEHVEKNKKCSMIVSSLAFYQGNYRKRLSLLGQILQSDLDIDIYGRGFKIEDSRYKGAVENKHTGLIPYEYSIAIENCNERNYITEKFVDCLLCNTIPIYNGAPNIAEVYDSRFFRTIDLDSATIINDIRTIIQEPAPVSTVNKNIYIDKYNLYRILRDIIIADQRII